MNELKKINDKINKLEIQRNILNNNSSNNINRKKRTRRLIQKGALLEKYFDIDYLSVEETEELLKVFSEYIKANKPGKFKKGKE